MSAAPIRLELDTTQMCKHCGIEGRTRRRRAAYLVDHGWTPHGQTIRVWNWVGLCVEHFNKDKTSAPDTRLSAADNASGTAPVTHSPLASGPGRLFSEVDL